MAFYRCGQSGGTGLADFSIAVDIGQKTAGTYTVSVDNDTDYVLEYVVSVAERSVSISDGANVINTFSSSSSPRFIVLHTTSTTLTYKVNVGTATWIILLK